MSVFDLLDALRLISFYGDCFLIVLVYVRYFCFSFNSSQAITSNFNAVVLFVFNFVSLFKKAVL